MVSCASRSDPIVTLRVTQASPTGGQEGPLNTAAFYQRGPGPTFGRTTNWSENIRLTGRSRRGRSTSPPYSCQWNQSFTRGAFNPLGTGWEQFTEHAGHTRTVGPDATLSKHGTYDAIDLPAVPGALTFSRATTPVVTTRGSVIDHIGFEVKDHGAFVTHLRALGMTIDPGGPAYHEPSGIRFAVFTDPWGLGIEATEGAARK